jgi:hypothetical protein
MDPGNTGRISRDAIMALFVILNEDYPEIRTLNEDETKIIFGFLDKDGSSSKPLNLVVVFKTFYHYTPSTWNRLPH